MNRVIALTFVVSLVGACGRAPSAVTQPDGSSQSDALQEVKVNAEDYFFEGIPETIEAGEIAFVFENEGLVRHELSFGRLIGDKSIEEIVRLPETQLGAEIERMRAGIRPIPPGESRKLTLDLEPGRYAYVCFVAEGTGKPHAFEGMVGEFTVA